MVLPSPPYPQDIALNEKHMGHGHKRHDMPPEIRDFLDAELRWMEASSRCKSSSKAFGR